MCRFLAYIGAPIIMDKLLYQPKNSLIHQSYHALERHDPVNGDGDGVGWYMPEANPEPAVFVSIRPAWNNQNLRNIAPKIQSGCIFAHVRAAPKGGDVVETNCHPFHYGKLLMMHNGAIGGFATVKRALCNRISNDLYNWVKGETDTEHFFALFLHKLLQRNKTDHSHQEIITALREATVEVMELLAEFEIDLPSYLNCVVTDGKCMVAMKYVSDPSLEAATLYRSEHGIIECLEGTSTINRSTSPSERGILIVSEKLNDVKGDWHEIPKRHFLVVKDDLSVYEESV